MGVNAWNCTLSGAKMLHIPLKNGSKTVFGLQLQLVSICILDTQFTYEATNFTPHHVVVTFLTKAPWL